jgi:hypothetical protein
MSKTKPKREEKKMAAYDNYRDILKEFYYSGLLIPEIYVNSGEDGDYPELTGVRVVLVSRDLVILEQAASPGVGTFAVSIEDITGIELPRGFDIPRYL